MQNLLLAGKFQDSSRNSEVRSVSRAFTTTTIKSLDSKQNVLLVNFLQEANLIETDSKDTTSNSQSLLLGLNLSEVDLRGAQMVKVRLSNADLSGANLEGARLSGAKLEGSNLSGANLNSANLEGADLSGANLKGANLSNAKLRKAILDRSQLEMENVVLCQAQLPEGLQDIPTGDCE